MTEQAAVLRDAALRSRRVRRAADSRGCAPGSFRSCCSALEGYARRAAALGSEALAPPSAALQAFGRRGGRRLAAGRPPASRSAPRRSAWRSAPALGIALGIALGLSRRAARLCVAVDRGAAPGAVGGADPAGDAGVRLRRAHGARRRRLRHLLADADPDAGGGAAGRAAPARGEPRARPLGAASGPGRSCCRRSCRASSSRCAWASRSRWWWRSRSRSPPIRTAWATR